MPRLQSHSMPQAPAGPTGHRAPLLFVGPTPAGKGGGPALHIAENRHQSMLQLQVRCQQHLSRLHMCAVVTCENAKAMPPSLNMTPNFPCNCAPPSKCILIGLARKANPCVACD